MSKHQFTHSLRERINLLNSRIDQKILRGQPYWKEARRHRALLAELRRIEKPKISVFNKFLSRSMSYVHFF